MPTVVITAVARNVSAMAVDVSASCADRSAASNPGSVIEGRSRSRRKLLKRPRPHAVSADRPTLNPNSRVTITSAAPAPR